MSDWLADAAPTYSAGPPPPVTFTRVGNLSGDRISFSNEGVLGSSEVWRCERCKSLVLADDCYDHVTHHAEHGLERWPDPDSGDLRSTEDDG